MPYLEQKVKSTFSGATGIVTAVFDDEIVSDSVCITWDYSGLQGYFTKDFRSSIGGSIMAMSIGKGEAR